MAASRPPPSFFSLMLDTSATALKISSEFVSKHLKNKIPKDPIIICANGGYSWRIKIKKIGENYYFDNGWTNVVKDVNFMFGDFVLFTLVDKYIFEMFVYGKDSCERSLPKKVKVEDNVVNVDVVNDGDDDDDDDDVYEGKEEEEEEEDDDDDVVDIDGDPFFISTISKAHKRNLRLPREFVGLPGIKANGTIMLKNLKGEEWRISVLLDKNDKKSERYLLSNGWVGFLRSNDISVGDKCVIKFIRNEGKLCLAKVTKKNTPARQPLPSSEILATTEVVKRNRGKAAVVKSPCGEDHDEEDDWKDDGQDNGVDDGKDDKDGDVGDPSFSTIIYKNALLALPASFAGLPRIKAGGTIMMKNLKGEEWRMGVRLYKSYQKSKRYVLSAGWAGFQRRNDLSDGDECIFKFIRKERKFCLAKVTKKQRQPWKPRPSGQILATEDVKRKRGRLPHEQGGDVVVESEDDCVELVKKPCGEDDEEDDKDSDVGDPSFSTIISKNPVLVLPAAFAGLPRIKAGGTIMLKNLQGEESPMGVRLDKSDQKSERYVLSAGWAGFLRSNSMLAGDECVFKFIRNEGKLCLVKTIRRKIVRHAHGRDVDVESEDECVEVVRSPCGEDNDNDNDNGNGHGNDNDGEDDGGADIDGNPFFMATITGRSLLRIPAAFVVLPGINANGTIVLKNLDGEEWRLQLRLEKVNQSEKLYLSSGWADFQQSNDLREGDECIFKFITSEGKILLAKVTKKKRPARQSQPSGECSKTEVVKRKRGWELHAHGSDVNVESEDEYMERVKRLHGNDDDDDVYEGKEEEDDDDDVVDIDGHDGDPFFISTISKSHKRNLRLPREFVGLPGIKANGTIMLKNLKGEEWIIGVLLDKTYRKSERYILSAGLLDFMRRNNILVGDECVFKFIRNERKLCLVKVTKKNTPARQPLPSSEIPATTKAVKRNRGQPALEDLGDPSFSTIIYKGPMLALPASFARLPRIKAGGTIMLKNLKGEEWRMGVRLQKSYQKSKTKRYFLSPGWAGFLRSNSISAGDECVFKYIRKERKLCLAKVTKKNSSTRQAQPSGEILVTEVVKRKREWPPSEDLGDIDVENEDECVEVVKRLCVEGDDDSQDDIDAGGGDIDGDVGDPSFSTIVKNPVLVLPEE